MKQRHLTVSGYSGVSKDHLGYRSGKTYLGDDICREGGHAKNWRKRILAQTSLCKGPEAGTTTGFLLSNLLKCGPSWLPLDGSKSIWEVAGQRAVLF